MIRDVLTEYSDVFNPALHPDGAKLPPFMIHLKPGAIPVKERPRPLPANVSLVQAV